MADDVAIAPGPALSTPQPRSRVPVPVLALIPLLLLAAVIALIVRTDGGLGDRTAPPIETLTIERVELPEPGQITIGLINDGPDPVTIAQVIVDDAYWQFTMSPATTLDRLDAGSIRIPYPWVEGEGHAILLVSSTGVTFPVDVPVAVESPQADRDSLLRLALVGFYVGVVPVTLGLLWFPVMRRQRRQTMTFILALTVGLLAFLVVDMFLEAQEVALTAATSFDAPVLVPLLALLTAGLLTVVGRSLRRRSREGALTLSYQIAGGIGLHNMGEGLAIGSAFALGEVALGVFLILGFTLHNVTEGIGIAAPLVSDRPRLVHFLFLGAIAGAPAILGTWIGALVYSPLWTSIFLAIGVGAIVQVIVEVALLIGRNQARDGQPGVTWTTLGGFTAGLVVMYATALLVTA